jgi:putative DNA primase/helicase
MTTGTLTPAEVRRQALAALRAGLCPIPPGQDGSKAPFGANQRWEKWQKERPSEAVLNSWYSNGRTGLGIVCGTVSGNLECLEFDDRPTYEAFLELAHASGLGDVVDRVRKGYESQSPGDGFHWPYRCAEIGGNAKLARRPKMPEEMSHPEDKVKVLIETRGQGGFIVEWPSYGKVHPTGRPYVLLSGGFDTIATVTPEERATLFEMARSFDQLPAQTKPGHVGHAGHVGHVDRGSREKNSSFPGADFNERGSWSDILHPHGWEAVYEQNGETYWRRPGKSEGISATTNYADSDLLYVFTTSTSLPAPRAYSKFAAYTLLNHQGDFKAAADKLSRLGYGIKTMPKRPKQHHPKIYYSIPEA